MRTREEQIIECAQYLISMRKDCKYTEYDLVERIIHETEQRVRAEIGRDSDRLDWLEKLPFADIGRLPNGWEICINNVRHWDVQPTLREAIDAAMETK